MQLFRAVSQSALRAAGFLNAAYFRLVTRLFYSPFITLEKNKKNKPIDSKRQGAHRMCLAEWMGVGRDGSHSACVQLVAQRVSLIAFVATEETKQGRGAAPIE